MTMQEYLTKYGYASLSRVIGEFILRAPEFKGDKQLAALLGEMSADLESALRSLPRAE